MQATATSASAGAVPPPKKPEPEFAFSRRASADDSDGCPSCPRPFPRRAAATAGRSVVSSHSSQFSWREGEVAGARAGPAVEVCEERG